MKTKKIHCKGCGSTNVRMIDHEPLEMSKDLDGQYDNELYATFNCSDCESSFIEVLKITIQ